MTTLLAIVVLIMVATLVYLVGSMVRSIANESKGLRDAWKGFGLSIALAILFLTTWVGQALSQWIVYSEEQRAHGEPVEIAGFLAEFGQSTLENWQSEFLQLFSFVVLAAILIHKGSAESKDSDEEMQRALGRIERRLKEMEATTK